VFGQADVSSVVWVLRLASVGFDIGTVVLVALAARLLAGDLAGLIAAAWWAFAQRLLVMTVLALADPLVTLLSTLVLVLALAALYFPERRRWVVWSTWVGIIATVVKYSAAPAILPGIVISLYFELIQTFAIKGR